MELEFHIILEFYNMTLSTARELEKILKGITTDAQLHGRSYENPLYEHQDAKGLLCLPRRMSVFAAANDVNGVQRKLDGLYKALNSGLQDYELVHLMAYNGEKSLRVV